MLKAGVGSINREKERTGEGDFSELELKRRIKVVLLVYSEKKKTEEMGLKRTGDDNEREIECEGEKIEELRE